MFDVFVIVLKQLRIELADNRPADFNHIEENKMVSLKGHSSSFLTSGGNTNQNAFRMCVNIQSQINQYLNSAI
jgi:hypothetical protein